MSSGQSSDPDPDRAPSAAQSEVEALFDGLSGDLEEFRRLRARGCADPCPDLLLALHRAERAVFARLRAMGWSPAEVDAAGSDADRDPATAALALVTQLAAAERDSGELVERIEGMRASGCREVIRAAQRCHGLIGDALVVGALDLAVRMGVPDGQLPL